MRRRDREVTDQNRIKEILDTARILHLGLLDGAYPYIVPMHYGYSFEAGLPVFFVHCAKEGHKLDLIHQNPNAFVELECDISLISGEDNPCSYGSAYASIMARAAVTEVTDPNEKSRGLNLLMQHQTNRTFAFTPQMMKAVTVLKIQTTELSAKERQTK